MIEKINHLIRCDGCAILLINNGKIEIPSEIGFLKTLGENVEFTKETPAIKYILDAKKRIVSSKLKESDFVSCVPEGLLDEFPCT